MILIFRQKKTREMNPNFLNRYFKKISPISSGWPSAAKLITGSGNSVSDTKGKPSLYSTIAPTIFLRLFAFKCLLSEGTSDLILESNPASKLFESIRFKTLAIVTPSET